MSCHIYNNFIIIFCFFHLVEFRKSMTLEQILFVYIGLIRKGKKKMKEWNITKMYPKKK